jgi:PncC family amidohydrolase
LHGGALAALLTALPGASQFFLGSLVVYSNAWKESFLGVSSKTIERYGAVSREVVVEMVQGLFVKSKADFAVAISGTLGPTGGKPEKPVGTVYIAVGERDKTIDAGLVHAPLDRTSGIDFAIKTAMAILWRRLVHNQLFFS